MTPSEVTCLVPPSTSQSTATPVSEGPDPAPAPSSLAPTAELELRVVGMTCASCVRRVEKALSAHPGVHSASVNFATERATVSLDSSDVEVDELIERVRNAGYDAVRIEGSGTLTTPALTQKTDAADREDDADTQRGDSRGGAGYPPDDAKHGAVAQFADSKDGPGSEAARRKRDLIAAAAASVPLLVLGMSHGAIPWSDAPVGRALQLALASFVVFGPGRQFFRRAWLAARHRAADMNTLVSIGTGAAYAYSAVAVLVPEAFPHAEHGVVPHVYFEAAGAIISFVLLGKWLEGRAKQGLTDAVRRLVALAPKRATRVSEGREEQVSIAQLGVGDWIIVRPGESVASDGVVVEGSTAIDESMLTGESHPVDKTVGDLVFGGTTNQSGAITVRIERTGRDTALSRIVRAVEQAQGSKAPIARLADQVSGVFVPVVLLLATLTFGVWLAVDLTSSGLAVAIERLVAVLVIACPCALGLATPAAVSAGIGRGAELGLLFKGGSVIEEMSRVDTVLFDKTGTLTEGRPQLTDLLSSGGDPSVDETELLAWVASVEHSSEHPVGRAIVEGALARGARLLPMQEFANVAGRGVSGRVQGRRIHVGTAQWFTQLGIEPSSLEPEADRLAQLGKTPSFVAVDGKAVGLIAVADRARTDSRASLQALRALGISVGMITGDRHSTAQAVAKELGIDEVFAEVTPEGKAEIVKSAQAAGRRVAMVGDGINDAPALATANIGIAMGSGSDIAVAAGDVALVRGGLEALLRAFALARQTLKTIRQNLFWAFVYNIAGIPLAAGVLVPYTGWQLSPVIASAAMSLSSLSVVVNSLRLRRFRG